MAQGETGGLDLTVETLEYIDDHWEGVAQTVSQASDSGFQLDTRQYDTVSYTAGGDVWTKPVLRNGDSKKTYPDGEHRNYNAYLRSNDVVTVKNVGRVDSPTGTEFDFDVEWELDVTCEALATGQTVIGGSTDFHAFVTIVRNCIMLDRNRPLTDPNCKFDWRWINVVDESVLPEAADNRDHYGKVLTVRWYGYEALPAI